MLALLPFIGRLGQDFKLVEIKKPQSDGKAQASSWLLSSSIATQDDEWVSLQYWLPSSVIDEKSALAHPACQRASAYTKGQTLEVEGFLSVPEGWQDKDSGKIKTRTRVRITRIRPALTGPVDPMVAFE